jgi:3-phenylpropionate/trans-cinnamate dioxygenase ferredoxin reductase subunit
MDPIIVVGAGQAGATLVEKLRSNGYDGELILIGDEPHLPYQRPPLSKKYLLGDMELERLFLRPPSFYDDQNITVRTDTSVVSIDADGHSITLANGEVLKYSKLGLCTGSIPNRLPAAIGGDLDNVFVVRGLADVDAMIPAFNKGGNVLIIGGGYIGLEAAAVAASRGLNVTLVEMGDRILQRVASPQTSDFFRELHTSKGVTILEGVGLKRLIGDGAVTGAELSDGSTHDIDFAILGIGIQPDARLAADAGLVIENGIKVDETGTTSNADVYAMGDCSSFPFQGGRIRLESVPNAIDQAGVAAQAMIGNDVSYTAKPWFWSDQYDVKLQIAGLNTGYDATILRMGDRPGAQSVWYFNGARLLAVDAMNDPRAYMIGKRWIEAGKSPSQTHVADTGIELKTMETS